MSEETLRLAVHLLGCATYTAYIMTLRGDVPFGMSPRFEFEIGDYVMETSTVYYFFESLDGACEGFKEKVRRMKAEGRSALDCIGRLKAVELTDVFTAEDWGDPTRPIPQKKIYVLETLDGREFRWENCSFIKVPNSAQFLKGWSAGFNLKIA